MSVSRTNHETNHDGSHPRSTRICIGYVNFKIKLVEGHNGYHGGWVRSYWIVCLAVEARDELMTDGNNISPRSQGLTQSNASHLRYAQIQTMERSRYLFSEPIEPIFSPEQIGRREEKAFQTIQKSDRDIEKEKVIV